MKHFSILLIFLCSALTLSAQVKLAQIFSDNMVLQRDKPIAVWGWSQSKEKIKVQFHNQIKSVVADKNGKWKIYLDAEKAGGPYSLTVSGKNTITIMNVLVGEVWICSGQSNMEWPLSATSNAEQEIARANYPQIRHIKIPNTVASQPKENFTSSAWEICSAQTAGDFTAVGYYFGVKLSKELNVPIGLINSSWGGTMSETWTSREAFESSDEYKSMIESTPVVDVEEISRNQKTELIRTLESIQGKLNVPSDEVSKWNSTEYNDGSWLEMEVPELWEEKVLPGLDGVVWLRKTITLQPDDVGKSATLELSMIDDSDETFVNGIKVGGLTAQYNVRRIYSVPASVLKVGKNVIAIRITDTGGGGGIYGNTDNIKLSFEDRTESLAGKWKLRVETIANINVVEPNAYPSLLYNAMINPLIPYTIQGAIWYQGEANVSRAYQYRKAFPLMISDWRKHWGQGDFPFYFVQLASFNENHGNSERGSYWAELREAQTMTLSLPRTGMAITTDIGDANDIHPRNKRDVGYRLAVIALADVYQQKIISSGPVYESLLIKEAQAIISFKNMGSTLMTPDKYGYLRGFEIAENDGKFFPAQAFIKGNQVVVQREGVTKPVAVRYNWADDASEGNLFNREGLPAGPFRTDSWKCITESVKFLHK